MLKLTDVIIIIIFKTAVSLHLFFQQNSVYAWYMRRSIALANKHGQNILCKSEWAEQEVYLIGVWYSEASFRMVTWFFCLVNQNINTSCHDNSALKRSMLHRAVWFERNITNVWQPLPSSFGSRVDVCVCACAEAE